MPQEWKQLLWGLDLLVFGLFSVSLLSIYLLIEGMPIHHMIAAFQILKLVKPEGKVFDRTCRWLLKALVSWWRVVCGTLKHVGIYIICFGLYLYLITCSLLYMNQLLSGEASKVLNPIATGQKPQGEPGHKPQDGPRLLKWGHEEVFLMFLFLLGR